MVRTIFWYAHFVVSLMGKIPGIFTIERLQKQGREKEAETYVHETTSRWALSQVKASGAEVSVTGLENVPSEGAVVFISNHQSNFDIAVLMSYINKPKGYISKVQMKKIPVLRTWMKYMHCVFIERGNPRKALEAIAEGVDTLKKGHSLVIFPEGTRSKGPKMGHFKPGSFKLATKAKVPIVPVTINGTYKLMEQNGGKIKKAEVMIKVHPAIDTKGLSREALEELPDQVREIIKGGLEGN